MKPDLSDTFYIALLVCFLMLTAPVSFAAGGSRTEQVDFKKAANTAVIEASIKGYETVDYVLSAHALQYMNVSLSTKQAATHFNILAPGQNEVTLFNGSVGQNQYEATLPASGEYTIRVYMIQSAAQRNEVAHYRLEMILDDREVQPELKSYDEPAMAIATKYPETMTVDVVCSGEGCGYFFTFNPQKSALDQSHIHLFLPAGAKTAEDAEIGMDSLMQSNGWKTVEIAPPASEFKYPWVKRIVPFKAEQGMSGYIMIGEIYGQGVRAVLLYPADLYDAFMPAAKSVLDNLQFKPEKLPINSRL